MSSTISCPADSATVVRWTTETDHDFGQVRDGSTARFVFQFQNLLEEPIVLQTVRTTCGCTAADWPEAPIGAGKSGDVVIEFDADKVGPFRKKITVFFDKQRKAETLWIRGEVY
jgi:hypothetical protein